MKHLGKNTQQRYLSVYIYTIKLFSIPSISQANVFRIYLPKMDYDTGGK